MKSDDFGLVLEELQDSTRAFDQRPQATPAAYLLAPSPDEDGFAPFAQRSADPNAPLTAEQAEWAITSLKNLYSQSCAILEARANNNGHTVIKAAPFQWREPQNIPNRSSVHDAMTGINRATWEIGKGLKTLVGPSAMYEIYAQFSALYDDLNAGTWLASRWGKLFDDYGMGDDR